MIMTSLNEKAACKKKKRFSNEAAAKDALKKINPARKLGKPYRIYKCPVCFGYHLTSSNKR
jgi:hypothetical protein